MFSQNSNDKELPCEMYVNNQSKDKHNKYKKTKEKELKKQYRTQNAQAIKVSLATYVQA